MKRKRRRSAGVFEGLFHLGLCVGLAHCGSGGGQVRLDYENDTATEPADGSAVCEVLGSTNQCRTGSVPVDFHFDRVELVQCVDAAGDLTACPQAVGIGDAYPLCEGEWREKSALSTSEHRDRDEGEPPVLRPHR